MRQRVWAHFVVGAFLPIRVFVAKGVDPGLIGGGPDHG